MIVDLSKLSEGEVEVLNNALIKTLEDIRHIVLNDPRLKHGKAILIRLDEYDLWNPNGIIEEYSLIKNKESKLPSTLRKAVCAIFESALVSLKIYKQNGGIVIVKNKQNEVQ